MSVRTITDEDARVNDLLRQASQEPLILQTETSGEFALIPLDDEVLDLLLERNPRLIEECRQIQERVNQGDYLTHDEVIAALGLGDPAREAGEPSSSE